MSGAFTSCALTTVYNYALVPQNSGYISHTDSATLHVVKGCKEIYASTKYWKTFANIIDDLGYCTDVNHFTPTSYSKETEDKHYTLDGRILSQPKHGLNIVRTADGRAVKKVCI